MNFFKKTKIILNIGIIAAILLNSSIVLANTGNIIEKQIVIYHTNDTHGYVTGDGDTTVGIAIAGALKDSTENSILLDAGDATQGLPIASLTKGSDIIELMNIAGYDLMAAGNHEFDFGTENFISNVKKANFPVLAANVYKDKKLLLENIQEKNNGCHTIIEKDGLKIGFFGITTMQTATAANPDGIKGVEFRNEIETAKKEIDELKKENVDTIIAICHMGNGDAPCTGEDLAKAMTGEYQGELDAIIDGHSHTIENTVENDVLIVQTGCNSNAIGKLTINVKEDDIVLSEELLKASDLTDIEPKKDVIEKLEKINNSQSEMLSKVIGKTPSTLWAGWIGDIAPTRVVETNFGDFAADAFKASAKKAANSNLPIVAVENGGGIREAALNGEITKGTLIGAFPFSNTLYVKEITPKILYDVMEVSGNCIDGQDSKTGMLLQKNLSGGFLQVSGCTVEFNPDRKNNKVTSITLEGQNKPLDKNDNNTKILLVSNNFIMSGGSDYTMLGELKKISEIGGELETIQNYFEECLENGILKGYSRSKNRIIMKGNSYNPKDYEATIKIVDSENNPVVNKKLSYIVDGEQQINSQTDSSGILKIMLSDGSHGIKLGNSNEVYIDNYTGIGIIEDTIRKYPQLTFLSDGSCDPVVESVSDESQKDSFSENTENSLEKTPFNDVPDNAWYAECVKYTYKNGLLMGVSENTFSPYMNVTRGMFVTALGRAENIDTEEYMGKNSFNDVNSGYYVPYIKWAAENNIVTGFENNTFMPEENLTREQMAHILANYIAYKNKEEVKPSSYILFNDVNTIAKWAKDSVSYCFEKEIIKGDDNNMFNPKNYLTRAELSSILMKITM